LLQAFRGLCLKRCDTASYSSFWGANLEKYYPLFLREKRDIQGVFGYSGSNDVTAIFVSWPEVTTPTD